MQCWESATVHQLLTGQAGIEGLLLYCMYQAAQCVLLSAAYTRLTPATSCLLWEVLLCTWRSF